MTICQGCAEAGAEQSCRHIFGKLWPNSKLLLGARRPEAGGRRKPTDTHAFRATISSRSSKMNLFDYAATDSWLNLSPQGRAESGAPAYSSFHPRSNRTPHKPHAKRRSG